MDVVAEARRLLSFRRSVLARCGRRADDLDRELREIDAALARIAEGTFGTCETCGGAIGRDRLRALPEARRCLGCAE